MTIGRFDENVFYNVHILCHRYFTLGACNNENHDNFGPFKSFVKIPRNLRFSRELPRASLRKIAVPS